MKMIFPLPFRLNIYIPVTLFLLVPLLLQAQSRSDWTTPFERSQGLKTATLEDTYNYLFDLAALEHEAKTPQLRPYLYGISPEGRDMIAFFCSRNGELSPTATAVSELPLVLVQGGIHSGEIDGKDAGMMLLREIIVSKKLAHLVDKANFVFLPVFNIDGHERISPYNRINQDGPDEMGWRTTAQNLNLNRDFLKADAPEMRAWLQLVNEAKPDVIIDCHVTDGIDFKYNVTYAMDMFDNAPPKVVAWQKELEKSMAAGMAAQDDPIFTYVFPRERRDLSKGLRTYAAPPRFSTGYTTIRNRVGILVEAHSLKPFKDRVESTYRLLIEVMKFVNKSPQELKAAVRQSEKQTEEMFAIRQAQEWYPVRFKAGDGSTPVLYHSFESGLKESSVTGIPYQTWDHDAEYSREIPFLNDIQPTTFVRPPLYYIIPQEWTEVLDVLRTHGVELQRSTSDATHIVRRERFKDVKFRETPYEGRHTVSFKSEEFVDTVSYPAGSYILDLRQPLGKIAVHILEPDAPDSFVFWGFFSAIFERKEYFEVYAMEPIAEKMLADDPTLKREYEAFKAADTTANKNARKLLNFIYERSPWHDNEKDIYPIGRLDSEPRSLDFVPEDKYIRNSFYNKRQNQ
jgi:zinc carboxypeptidase